MQTWDSMATSGSWTSSKFILGATSMLASAGGDPLFGIKRRSIGDQLVVKETSIVRDAGEISMGFVCFCAWQLAGFPFIPLFLRIQGRWGHPPAQLTKPWHANIVELLNLSA